MTRTRRDDKHEIPEIGGPQNSQAELRVQHEEIGNSLGSPVQRLYNHISIIPQRNLQKGRLAINNQMRKAGVKNGEDEKAFDTEVPR
jgi:hypothetical protein